MAFRESIAGRVVVGVVQLAVALVACALATVVIITPLSMREQYFFGLATFLTAVLVNRFTNKPGKNFRLVTLGLMVASSIATLRYLNWRISSTLDLDAATDIAGAAILLFAEAYANLMFFLGYFQLAWPLDRKPTPMPPDPDTWPTVDVFIPTYNEPLKVVRATVLAAQAMDWPETKMHVFLLDDGRRNEFRQFAADVGVGYLIRDNNAHAKAGNINAALQSTRGEYIAIFDCDHVPTRSFLQLTMGWFIRDPNMAMVQTPHHFNSPDPFEKNLKTFHKVPNEGELFYGLIQPGNDLWNAAFFCGSCAVIRRTSLLSVGGIATDTVTEDAHTALRLHRKGYHTAYISIPQASGLATESLSAHIGQRIRWARGMVQIFRTDNPLIGRGLTIPQRLCYLSAMAHFLHAIPRLIFLLAPLAFLVGGMNIVSASPLMLLAFAIPHLAHATLTMSRVQGAHRHSFWSEIYEVVLSTYILIPTTLALINPNLGKFNVTAKGGVVQSDYFDRKIARPYIVLLLINLVGFGFGIWRLWTHRNPTSVIAINLAWSLYNLMLLGAAVAVAWEAQQRRSTTRINVRLPVMVRLSTGHTVRGVTLDLSQGGTMVDMPPMPALMAGDQVTMSAFLGDEEIPLPCKVVGHRGSKLQLEFTNLSVEQESGMVQLLYARANAWTKWSDGMSNDKPLTAMWAICRHAMSGIKRLTVVQESNNRG